MKCKVRMQHEMEFTIEGKDEEEVMDFISSRTIEEMSVLIGLPVYEDYNDEILTYVRDDSYVDYKIEPSKAESQEAKIADICNSQYHTIDELTGYALEKALADTKVADFEDNDEITREDLIEYNRMTGAIYEGNGEFVDYNISFYNVIK